MRWILKARPASSPARPGKKRAASSSRCCGLRRRCASPGECWGCPATSASTRTCRSTRFRLRDDKGTMIMDDAAKAPKSHYATEDRIGVLEELLNERYSVRAFLPREVPR